MPTVILLDVSLSMARPVTNTEGQEDITRKQLAKRGIYKLLDHFAAKLKLEFVSLVIFSSLGEQMVGFTRDYATIKSALDKVGDYNKTCIETALRWVASLCIEEWTSVTPCQVVLVTDGNAGIGEGSLKRSLQNYAHRDSKTEEPFPLPFKFPCKLHVMCISPEQNAADMSLQLYEKLIEINNNRGELYLPDGALTTKAVENMFNMLAVKHFSLMNSVLKCGNLKCGVQLFPALESYDRDHDFEHVSRDPSQELNICGFLDIGDVASPPFLTRHLVLPLSESRTENGEEVDGEDQTLATFTVLLHGSLKLETMVAVTKIADDWYGILYSWADSKKKANLMLKVFQPGIDVVPWLGSLEKLGPLSEFDENPYGEDDCKTPFPVRPTDRRSYTQNCVVWIKQSGLQADIQKILRNAKKIPEKQQNFYKELNRLRRAALSLGFHTLLEALAQLLERECTFLPGNAHPEASLQLSHAAQALRSPEALNYHENIVPMTSSFS